MSDIQGYKFREEDIVDMKLLSNFMITHKVGVCIVRKSEKIYGLTIVDMESSRFAVCDTVINVEEPRLFNTELFSALIEGLTYVKPKEYLNEARITN